MYDINIKNVKKGRRFYYIFLLAGLLFLIILGSVFISSIIKAKKLDATVLSTRVEVRSHIDDEGSTMYSPVYYYEARGESYSCGSNSSSSINPGNENKLVYYESSNPSNCMTEYSKSSNNWLLLVMLLPIVFIVVAIININKVNKRIKIIKELNQKGKLVKGLPYRLENTGVEVNNVPIQRPVVDYILPNGNSITLYGDGRHDRKTYDADGMVDLLIDDANPENYYIDFEINRINGNLKEDYYQQTSSNVINNMNTQNNVINNVEVFPNINNQPIDNQLNSNQNNNFQ